MNTINLYTTSQELKQYFNVKLFFGEKFFIANANVKIGDLVPVYLLDVKKQNYYLHLMRWGINIFEGNDPLHIGRFENIMKYHKWNELLQKQQTCVMVLKGYYFHDHRSIFNSLKGIMEKKNDMYYVHANAQYIYVAGLFEKKITYQGIQYSVVALTIDSTNKQICNRMPLMLNNENVYQWLTNKQINLIPNKQNVLKFKEIGFWIQDKNEKEESIVLQSRQKWIMDQEAKNIGFEDIDFPWDIMEHTALEAVKMKEKSEDHVNEDIEVNEQNDEDEKQVEDSVIYDVQANEQNNENE